ncbi:MAG: IS110 family transposase [Thermodesulfovibrionales bacterium]|nr:IS110 family transposase [Nitrospirota bacterium]MCG2757457.1 IS110 family transposase [Desulfobacteraceae bacterium]MDP3048142.1 IS110 family transposase [Thermodesulfovibrionales bacterium]
MIISKTENEHNVNGQEMLVGIDVAKQTHVARILLTDGRESKAFSFHNTREGFESLMSWLMLNKMRFGCSSILAGLESTGHYWEALAFFLDGENDIRLVQVNPKYVKKTKELYDNSPGKTDSKDAGVIAMLIRMGKFQRLVLPKGHFAELRCYSKLREQKVVGLGVQRNILHSLVDPIFPEYGGILKKLESKTSLHILKNFTTPDGILIAGIKKLTFSLRTASHGRHSHACAERLYSAASTTIGVREGIEAAAYAIRSSVAAIENIQKDISVIEKELLRVLQKIPYAGQLLSIPGIGPVSLAIILGEAGDLHRYKKAEELIKLAGLNLFEISSGKHHGQRHITKRGRPLLRKCLFFAALRTVKTGGTFREDYLRHTKTNQMHKTKALVAISRKLLRVLFALVRDGVQYNQKKMELLAA